MTGPRVYEIPLGGTEADIEPAPEPVIAAETFEPSVPPRVFEVDDDTEWAASSPPDVVVRRRQPRHYAGIWILAGLLVLFGTWLGLSLVQFTTDQYAHAPWMGVVAVIGFTFGAGLIIVSVGRDFAAYRRLKSVDRVRGKLLGRDLALSEGQAAARIWIDTVPEGVVRKIEAQRIVANATSVQELLELLVSGPGKELRTSAASHADSLSKACGVTIAACPHPAFDALVAGYFGLRLVLRVATDHGLRAGPLTTIALVRHLMATGFMIGAVETVANATVKHLADNSAMGELAAEFAGFSVAKIRFTRLAILTHQACSPLHRAG